MKNDKKKNLKRGSPSPSKATKNISTDEPAKKKWKPNNKVETNDSTKGHKEIKPKKSFIKVAQVIIQQFLPLGNF